MTINSGDRIFPFLWLNDGVSENDIRKEIDSIAAAGLSAFCVESRIFEDFCGDQWWKAMRRVLRYAKKRDMRVWLLDDKRYPTGIANGAVARAAGEYRAKQIVVKRTDAIGGKKRRFLLKEKGSENDKLLGAFLAENIAGMPDIDRAVEVTGACGEFFADLYVPRGTYSLLSVFQTDRAYELPDQIDMMNAASVDLLLENVYEPHYAHFKSYFGNTFAGFFSDEPRIANGVFDYKLQCINIYGYKFGLSGMGYPWSDGIAETLQEMGFSLKDALILWYGNGKKKSEYRCAFADAVTRLYSKNFALKLSDWCHRHSVAYAGHVIEDMGAHTTLGSGTGHYFRSMAGADFAAIDIVLHQVKPYYNRYPFFSAIEGGLSDPRFFNLVLPIMASSDSLLDERKQGNALCEIFGAFGWGESISGMLWMANAMLVAGINAFIPHAFSAIFPNEDSPPHFHAGGRYCGKKGFDVLMRYLTRMCERFSGGSRYAEIALLYNAEADWSGDAYFPLEYIAQELAENQISFDIVPYDKIAEGKIKGDKLHIGSRAYSTVLVPACASYPKKMAETFAALARSVSVLQVTRQNFSDLIKRHVLHGRTFGFKEYLPDIRVMRYEKGGRTEFLVFNAGYDGAEGVFVSDRNENMKAENPLTGEYRIVSPADKLYLRGGEVMILSPAEERVSPRIERCESEEITEVSFSAQDEEGKIVCEGASFPVDGRSVNETEGLSDFAGKAVFCFNVVDADALEIVYEGEYLEITADKKVCRIGSPVTYVFENGYTGTVRLETANVLANRYRDVFSKYAVVESIRIESIKIFRKERSDASFVRET